MAIWTHYNKPISTRYSLTHYQQTDVRTQKHELWNTAMSGKPNIHLSHTIL